MMRIINEALEDILKHRMTSMLMVSIIAVSVFMSSLFLSLVFNLDAFQARWSQNVRLYVFAVDTADMNLIQEEAKKITGVISAQKYSSEEAVEILKKKFPEQDVLYSSTIVPSFIEIRTGINELSNVRTALEKVEGVDDIIVNSAWFNALSKLIALIKYVASAVILLLLSMALVMIAYSSRIGVLERKPEINLMRLCGATEWRLRTPYMFSGIILGFIGGGLGIAAYLLLKSFLQGTAVTFMSSWKELPLLQIAILYLCSIMVGALGNLAAFFRGSHE